MFNNKMNSIFDAGTMEKPWWVSLYFPDIKVTTCF